MDFSPFSAGGEEAFGGGSIDHEFDFLDMFSHELSAEEAAVQQGLLLPGSHEFPRRMSAQPAVPQGMFMDFGRFNAFPRAPSAEEMMQRPMHHEQYRANRLNPEFAMAPRARPGQGMLAPPHKFPSELNADLAMPQGRLPMVQRRFPHGLDAAEVQHVMLADQLEVPQAQGAAPAVQKPTLANAHYENGYFHLNGNMPFHTPALPPQPTETSEQAMLRATRTKIQNLFAPYQDSAEKPPFTIAQLVVMILMLHNKPMSIGEICLWLHDHFGYYKAMARKHFGAEMLYFRYGPSSVEAEHPTRSLKNRMLGILWQFEVPVRFTWKGLNAPTMLEVGFGEGERFLGDLVREPAAPTKENKCLFFDKLPPELRNMVYAMVFEYPQAGVMPAWQWIKNDDEEEEYPGGLGKRQMVLLTPTRSYGEAFDENAWARKPKYGEAPSSPYGDGDLLRTEPIADILDCLRTSRQFKQEAHSFFFATNHFYFSDPTSLKNVLTAIFDAKPEYLQCFRHISLKFNIYSQPGDDLRILGKAKLLSRFEFHVDEQRWGACVLGVGRRGRGVDRFVGLPVVRRSVRAREVVFRGCPTLERLLKEEMTVVPVGEKEGEVVVEKRKGKGGKKRVAGGAAGVRSKKVKGG